MLTPEGYFMAFLILIHMVVVEHVPIIQTARFRG